MSGEHWLKITLLVGLVVAATVAAAMFRGSEPRDWMFWLIWPAMAIHQCEENVFSELILGRAGKFTEWVRTIGFEISPRRAMVLNAGVGWTMAIAGGLLGEQWPLVPLFVAIVEAINGLWHLSVTSLTRRWSPGTLSGIVIAVPLAFFLVNRCIRDGSALPVAVFALFVFACAAHHAFLMSLPRVTNPPATAN
jgi:hypothetical protein